MVGGVLDNGGVLNVGVCGLSEVPMPTKFSTSPPVGIAVTTRAEIREGHPRVKHLSRRSRDRQVVLICHSLVPPNSCLVQVLLRKLLLAAPNLLQADSNQRIANDS